MIEKKKIERLPVLPVKAQGSDIYVGRIRMYKDTIVMDVYDASRVMCPEGMEKDAEIDFRWVCDKANYYVYHFRSRRWNQQTMMYAMGFDYYTSRAPRIRLDAESKKIEDAFLEGWEGRWLHFFRDDAVGGLLALEEEIQQNKRMQRLQNRESRINARQEKRGPLPKNWERWLDTNVYKDQRYIFYRTKVLGIGTCSHCKAIVQLEEKAKHNGKGKCPSCGSRIQYKAIGKLRSTDVVDRKQVIYLQKIENGILVRYLRTEKYSSPGNEAYRTIEVAIDTYAGGKLWRDYSVISGMTGIEYWTDNRPADMVMWSPEGYLYTRNIRRVLKDTVFKYAPLAEWMKHEKGEIPVGDFMAKYPENQFLEFFIKAGLYRLTEEYIKDSYAKWTGSDMKEILGINKQRLRRLIGMNGGCVALSWLRYEERTGQKVSDETLQWLLENHLTPGNCESILPIVGSVVRMVNYIRKQPGDPRGLIITWGDYLRMARNEGLNVKDDIVRFPKSLRLSHNQMVAMAKAEEEKKRLEKYIPLDCQIQERLPEAARYCWENEKYMIVPAAKCEELMQEGRILHHCVGRDDHYMKKMAAGEIWILFLRKKESLDTPYYTIEIRMEDDEIRQWYSEFDRKPDEVTIRNVLKEFKSSIKKRKRVRIPVQASA